MAAFPLQLLLRRHPDWAQHPTVVVAEDTPRAEILWVNEHARRSGVLPGLRYAVGLSLAGGLRAGVVSESQIAEGVGDLAERLRRFTPDVEPASGEPGVFWLGAGGLERLYPSLDRWARAISRAVHDAGCRAAVVVGFTRFGTYAVSKVRAGVTVFRDQGEERAAALCVPLDRLHLDPELREALWRLGITTVEGLVRLPAGGLRERFGADAHALHATAAGDLWAPLQPEDPIEAVGQRQILDAPEADAIRLLFLLKRLLHPLLAALAERGEALAELSLRLLLDRAGWRTEQIRPASPTLDEVQILDLVRLRLESGLPAGAVEIELLARGAPAAPEQLRLFVERPPRDLDAADRALARLRAEFGDGVVVRATLRAAHLPEARFTWEPLERVALPDPKAAPAQTLARRIFARPIPLPPKSGHLRDDGWVPLAEYGPVDRLTGPYVISGGWWRQEVHREYYFAQTRRGDLLWVYYDRRRRRWFLHGRVE